MNDNSTSYQKIQIECPVCHNKADFAIFDTIEITDDNYYMPNGKPSIWAHLSEGSLFMYRCRKCGFREPMTYKMVCLDTYHGILVSVVENSTDEYAAQVTFDEMMEQTDAYICRIVNSTEDLSEKLRIISDGLDDKKIELLKYILTVQLTEETVSNNEKIYYEDVNITITYSHREDDGTIILYLDGLDNINETRIPYETYLNMQKLVPIVQYNEYKIDKNWAEQALEDIDEDS